MRLASILNLALDIGFFLSLISRYYTHFPFAFFSDYTLFYTERALFVNGGGAAAAAEPG